MNTKTNGSIQHQVSDSFLHKKVYFSIAFSFFLFQSTIGFLWAISGSAEGILLAASGLAMVIIYMPFYLNIIKPDPFNPLALASFALLLGTGLRVPYVIFTENHSRAEFLFFGQSINDVLAASGLILLGIAAFTIGYCSTIKRFDFSSILKLKNYHFSKTKLLFYSSAFGILGFISALLFLHYSGISLSDGLEVSSRKIFFTYELSSGELAQGAGGHLRFLVNTSVIAFVTILCLILIRHIKINYYTILLLLFLMVPSILVPFISSSRSDIALLVISVFIFLHYYGKLKKSVFIAGFASMVIIITIMGEIRSANMAGVEIRETPIDAIVGSGNGLDFIRTAGIIYSVPNVTDYMYGKTYSYILTFFIPRSMWPEKPNVALGPWIKEVVFGEPVPGNNGWPSGTIAEAYLNFGAIGIPIIMFLYGVLCRIFYNSFYKELGKNIALTILYSYVIWRFGVSMFGLNISHGLSQTIILGLPMVVFLYLSKAKTYG